MPTVRSMTADLDRFRWLPVLALTAGTLWTVTAELLPAGLLLDIGDDTGVAPGTVGHLVTVWGVAIAALSLPLTRATRLVDRRTLLVGALAATGAATVLTSLAPTYPLLFVARTVAAAGHGLFWALVVVAARSLVAEHHAARAVAIVVAGPSVATVAAIPAATALGEVAGWRVAFGVVGLLTVVTGALLAMALPRIASASGQTEPGRRDPSVVPVVQGAVLGALLLLAHFMTFTFVAPILTGPGELARSMVSVALLVFGVAGVLGLLAAPLLAGRLPAASFPVTGALLAFSLLALHATNGREPLQLAAIGVWGVAIGALPVVFQIRVLALASPAFLPMAGAVTVVALNLGVASGAAAGGLLHDHVGAGPLPLVAAALAALASLGLGLLASPRAAVSSLPDRFSSARPAPEKHVSPPLMGRRWPR